MLVSSSVEVVSQTNGHRLLMGLAEATLASWNPLLTRLSSRLLKLQVKLERREKGVEELEKVVERLNAELQKMKRERPWVPKSCKVRVTASFFKDSTDPFLSLQFSLRVFHLCLLCLQVPVNLKNIRIESAAA